MINFNSLMTKKIDYRGFMKRMLTEDLEISQREEEEVSEISRKSSYQDPSPFKKNKVTNKR